MSKEEIEKLADEIAEKANECCNRSDGYEEEIRSVALKALEKTVNLPKWISFEDQEPPLAKCPSAPFGEPVLVTDGKTIAVGTWGVKRDSDKYSYMFSKYEVCRPEAEWWMGDIKLTHWMPLSALPGKESHDKRKV